MWAGPSWAGGRRLIDNKKIDWTTPPCYNESIKGIETNPNLNPESCYSLVDAITKTHDWRYAQAEDQYAIDHDEAKRTNAYLAADVLMLQSVATALQTGAYVSPTGDYNKITGTWTEKTYTGTFDITEKTYLTGLVPGFIGKIELSDKVGIFAVPARSAALTIISSIPIDGKVLGSSDPSCKTILKEKNGVIILQQEKQSSSDTYIMDLQASASKPVGVYISYGADSIKAANSFGFKDDGTILINGGTGNDKIKITGANTNCGIFKFEIAGGGGYDAYYLDNRFSYKLIDSGTNVIFISDGNGDWYNIDNLYKSTADSSWKSLDGSIVLTGNTITLPNSNTIELGAAFQSGDFGINLITIPDDPTTTNTFLGDLTPVDFDPNTPGIQTQADAWGNIITDPNSPDPGRIDYLTGTPGSDKIMAGAGDDVIWPNANGGNDWLQGGEGNDFIVSLNETSMDLIEGGSGADTIDGGGGSDQIFCENQGEMETLIAHRILGTPTSIMP